MSFGGLSTVVLLLSLLALTTAQCSNCECTTCDFCQALRTAGQCITVDFGDSTNYAEQQCVIVQPHVVINGFTNTLNQVNCLFLETGAVVRTAVDMGPGNDCIFSNGGTFQADVDMGNGRDCFVGDLTLMSNLDLGGGDDVTLLRDVDTDSTGNSVHGNIRGQGGDDCISIVGTMPGDPTKRDALVWHPISEIPQAHRPELDSFEAYDVYRSQRELYKQHKRQFPGSPGVPPLTPARSLVGDILGGNGRDCIVVAGTDFDVLNGNNGDDDMSVTNAEFTRFLGGPGNDFMSASQYLAPVTPASVNGGSGDDSVRATDSRSRGALATVAGGQGTDDRCCTDFMTVRIATSCELTTCLDFNPTTQPPTAPPTTMAPTLQPTTVAPTTPGPTTVQPTTDPLVPTVAPTTPAPVAPTTAAPLSPQPVPDQFIFTEMLVRPNSPNSPTLEGEYLELVNIGQRVDIAGCMLSDQGMATFVIPAQGRTTVDNGQRVLFIEGTPKVFPAGAPWMPDAIIYTSITLGDARDEVVLTCNGDVIAQISWDISWQIRSGRAHQLSQAVVNQAVMTGTIGTARDRESWCPTPDGNVIPGLSNLGTPDAVNVDCP